MRGSFAPCEMTSGRMRSRRSRADPQEPAALGPAQPLVAVAGLVRGAPGRRGRAGPCPARGRRRRACRCRGRRSASTSASIGKTSAVGLVTWLTTARRVRGVTAARMRLDHARPGPSIGKGIGDDHHARPVAGGHGLHRVDGRVVLVVVGQQLVARLEAQALEDRVDAGAGVRHEREALRDRRRGRPRPRRSRRRAGPRGSRVRNATGSCSSRSRKPRWTASTSLGHAPYEPWLRNATAGSSCQPRSVRISRRRPARRAG